MADQPESTTIAAPKHHARLKHSADSADNSENTATYPDEVDTSFKTAVTESHPGKQGLLSSLDINTNSLFGYQKPRKLPEWLDHFNAADLKSLFKASVAVWILTVFMVIDPVLSAEGQALFFGAIVLFIVPPTGIVMIQLLAGVTILVGMAIAWAWCVIVMKAALAARPSEDLNRRLGELVQAGSQTTTNVNQATSQTTYTQILIFEGFMLDTRVSVTVFCLCGIFIYFMARLRVANPKLVLVSIFSMVVADIFLVMGPLLPTFQGTIPLTMIKPAATAVGVGVLCNILFFPQSTSYIVLRDMQTVLSPINEFIDACRLSFDQNFKPMSIDALQTTKRKGIGSFTALTSGLGFLKMDISVCRWNSEDILLLREPLRQVFVTYMSLLQAQINRSEQHDAIERFKRREEKIRKGEKWDDDPTVGKHHVAKQLEFARLFLNDGAEELMNKTLNAFQGASDPILVACKESIQAIEEALVKVNGSRWFGRLSDAECRDLHNRHAKTLEILRTETTQFLAVTPSRLLDPHAHLFDEKGVLSVKADKGLTPIRGIILSMILEQRVFEFANAVEQLLAQIVAFEDLRTNTRLWLPTGLQNIVTWAFNQERAPQAAPVMSELKRELTNAGIDAKDSGRNKKTKNKKKSEKKTKDKKEDGNDVIAELAALHSHPARKRSTVGRIFLSTIHWFTNSEGMFALRVLVATIALALPAVFPTSAGFYYREKGMWALIMAQFSMVPYAADFTYGLIIRTVGTVAGGVLGMLIWYIGAGNGPGNSYGMAAITAVAIIGIMWCRLFGPPQLLQGIVILGATLYLVIGYSWVNTHIPSYGNPGVGYQIFWRRVLLVLVGFAAGFIVMFFPRPPSGSRHYRKVLSTTLSDFMDRYALFITDYEEKVGKKEFVAALEKETLATSEALMSIEEPIQLLKFEFSSSDFTSVGLSKIRGLCTKINFDLFQLFSYSSTLPISFKQRFSITSGAFESEFVGDIMGVLSLLGHALESGKPMPSVMPAPLLVRAFRNRALRNRDPTSTQSASATAAEVAEHADDDNISSLLGPITRSMIEEEEEGFRKYCVVLSAMVGMLQAVDQIIMVVKSELGESHFVDLEKWRPVSPPEWA